MDWRKLISETDPVTDCLPSTQSWLAIVAPHLRPERFFSTGWLHCGKNRQVSYSELNRRKKNVLNLIQLSIDSFQKLLEYNFAV
jgi:hypothetical protein